MSDTILQRIKAAFFAEVQTVATAASASSFRARTEPLENYPAINLVWGGCPKDSSRTNEDRFTLSADLHLYVTGDDAAAADVAIDSLYGPLSQMIGNLSFNNPLMGLAEDVREVGTQSPEEADTDAALVVNVEIEFVTKQNDPYNLPT